MTSKQRLALAICDFLTSSTTDGTLGADDKESIDVAVNCIAESFKIAPPSDSANNSTSSSKTLLQIFEQAESSGSGSGSDPAAAAAVAAAAAPYANKGRPTEAQIKEAEELKSKGNRAMTQRDHAEAIACYTRALALDPGNATYLSNRAAAHSAARDHESARRDAEAAVALRPSYDKAWSRLGLARFALGDAKGSMDAYRRGIEAEGNGGSEAMRKGFETAKRRVDELEAEGAAGAAAGAAGSATRSAGAGAGAAADPMGGLASLLGGGGGAGGGGGGMPDLGSIMSNPAFASMAQNLMSNPSLMGNLMSNPRLREMANQFTSGGGMPDLDSLMSDPSIAEMARNMMGGGGAGGAGGAGAGAGAGAGSGTGGN